MYSLNVMDIITIMNIMNIMNIINIMIIINNMRIMNIMNITAWMAMAGAVSALVLMNFIDFGRILAIFFVNYLHF